MHDGDENLAFVVLYDCTYLEIVHNNLADGIYWTEPVRGKTTMAHVSLFVDRSSPFYMEKALYLVATTAAEILAGFKAKRQQRAVAKILASLDARTLRDIMPER
ncbi:hypothetical protein [Kiloniella laminariae]|uniref:hypothetical protein n=1 Tax=Kiloniella laminariae TaxID=454162 RepID=UPI0003610D2D|nr:hypothetical protein [Kiloniella laminariae]